MFTKPRSSRNVKHLSFFILFILSVSLVSAEAKYTREKSEEIFHLINWYNYTPETFNQALQEQKPIFLMVSAPAWCYWCHSDHHRFFNL